MWITNYPMFIKVEYCPCVILNECWNMMKELLQSMVGNSAETPPPVLKHKPDTVYTPSDTILQYLDHFNNFRKAVSAPPPSRWCPSQQVMFCESWWWRSFKCTTDCIQNSECNKKHVSSRPHFSKASLGVKSGERNHNSDSEQWVWDKPQNFVSLKE